LPHVDRESHHAENGYQGYRHQQGCRTAVASCKTPETLNYGPPDRFIGHDVFCDSRPSTKRSVSSLSTKRTRKVSFDMCKPRFSEVLLQQHPRINRRWNRDLSRCHLFDGSLSRPCSRFVGNQYCPLRYHLRYSSHSQSAMRYSPHSQCAVGYSSHS
jgi:hypothetical protein